MIQSYTYRLTGSEKKIHCGQCDELDFKNFWKRTHKEISFAFVKRVNPDEKYMFIRIFSKGSWKKLR